MCAPTLGGGAVVDRHDHLLSGEGCHALFARVSFALLALGESPQGHEIFYRGAFLELLLDGVCMVRTSHLEGWFRLATLRGLSK
jgi:hypothetical protein